MTPGEQFYLGLTVTAFVLYAGVLAFCIVSDAKEDEAEARRKRPATMPTRTAGTTTEEGAPL